MRARSVQLGLLGAVLSAGCVNAGISLQSERGAKSGVTSRPVAQTAALAVRGPDAPQGARLQLGRPPPQGQVEAYRADRAKSILELQQFRERTRLVIDGFADGPVVASLIDLNPRFGTWYLLRLETSGGRSAIYHIENPDGARLRLDAAYRSGIVIERGQRGDGQARERFECELWPGGTPTPLTAARASRRAYAPLCDGRLSLRNPVEGRRTPKEHVVDLLRDHVWQGEEITVLVRSLFYRDAYRVTSDVAATRVLPAAPPAGGPAPLRVSLTALDRTLEPVHLAIELADAAHEHVAVGRWYPARDNPGVFVTTLRPDLVSAEVVAEQGRRVAPLDAVESAALVYLVAFDLAQFDLGFRLGTDHPRVDWSDMVLPSVRDAVLAGPDGFGTTEPLVRTGMLDPAEAGRVAATFTGGFKRTHGAFRMSDLALSAHGSHYGFVENGVVLSKLRPGLATTVVFDDGSVDLRTWTEQGDADLPRVRHARQNGVAILERDPRSPRGVPGGRVRDWGAGNWSGSADKKLRTLRAGLCLQETQGRRFLVYGYFSSATPSAMARVFQASGCRYAMLLDMNALEHTYLAVYHRQGARLLTQHLIDDMSVVDGTRNGEPLPRFVSMPDNRDFFYLLRRGRP